MVHSDAPGESSENGFTIIELLMYIILVGALSSLVITAMLDYWSGAATLINDNETLVSRADAGDTLRSYLNVASNLINQNSIPDTNALDSDPAAGSSYWLAIHAIPGSTAMPAAGSYAPIFYFEAPSVTSSRSFIMNGSQPYYNEFVLYLNGTTKQLLLRTLVNPGATGDRLKTSCPAASASASCPADLIMSDNISSVDLSYYSKSGNSIDYTSSTDPLTGQYNGPDFAVAEVVSITLHLSRKSVIGGGTNTLNQTVIRVALRN
jgi:type II secretory pathway pseudopilin PulG